MERKKALYIAIDPGYDQFKILIRHNDCIANFAFPSQLTPAGSAHRGLNLAHGNFYLYAEDGNAYLCGTAAESALISTTTVTENRESLDINKGIERFKSINFKYALEGAIAYSLYLFSKHPAGEKSKFSMSSLSKYTIYIGITLPHDLLDSDDTTVLSYIKCKHNFKYHHVGEMPAPVVFDYDFSSVPVIMNSQAVLAFNHYAMDDDGDEIAELSKHLPCIVYDAGYKTVGRFNLTMNKDIKDAESNTDYAMYNAYEATIKRINDKTGGNFAAFQVPVYINLKRNFKIGTAIVDPEPIYQEELDKLRKKACEDLMKEWENYINESELLLIAGGTGYAYYEHFKEMFNRYYPGVRVELANGEYNGYDFGPIFAIVIGLLKYMDSEIKAHLANEE